jgi:hypothetical protein
MLMRALSLPASGSCSAAAGVATLEQPEPYGRVLLQTWPGLAYKGHIAGRPGHTGHPGQLGYIYIYICNRPYYVLTDDLDGFATNHRHLHHVGRTFAPTLLKTK